MKYVLVTLLLGFLIFIHELGHFWAGKRAGIPIRRFSVGFGPRLWSRRFGGTEYCLSAIPLGGYVLPDIDCAEDLYSYSVGKRIFFALGGPLFNLIAAYVFLIGANVMAAGISYQTIVIKPVKHFLYFTEDMFAAFGVLVSQPDQISGVVGIVATGASLVQNGLMDFLLLSAILSLNVAIFNLLPIPVMDGGQIILALLEKISPKVNKVRIPLAVGGWILVLGIMIYVTKQDITKLMGT